MAVSYISSASAAAATVTMPTHAAGDLIIVFAYRDGNATAPTLPAGYVDLHSGGANTNSARVGYKIAASSSETTGTWTSSTGIVVHVYRGARVGQFAAGGASANSIAYPAITLLKTNTTSWVARFGGHRTATNMTTNVSAGFTQRTGVAAEVQGSDTNGTVSSNTSGTQSVNQTSGYRSYTIEILDSAQVPKVETVTDNFDDGTINSSIWDNNWSGGAAVESGGVLTINNGISDTAYHGLERTVPSDFYDSYALAEVVSAGNQALASWEVYPVQMANTMNGLRNELYFMIAGGLLYAANTIAGTATLFANVSYNATTMRWVRLRSAGATVYWEYTSAAGYASNTWTLLTSKTAPFNISAVGVQMLVGTWSAEASATSGVYDNFNVLPSTSSTNNQTATAKIANNITRTQTSIAKIANTGSRTQNAISRIANNSTRTQTATATINSVSVKTQPAISRIANTRTQTQTATARVWPSTFMWQGYEWLIRDFPGEPQYNGQWNPGNVILDSNGYVNLSVSNPTGTSPFGGEINSTKIGWGYGTYTTVQEGRLDLLDTNHVWGGVFTYDGNTLTGDPSVSNNEIDFMETSGWGVSPPQVFHNYFYNAGGVKTENPVYFDPTTDLVTTHVVIWAAGQITFRMYAGTGTGGTLIKETIQTTNIPVPALEQIMANSWVSGDFGTPNDVPPFTIKLRSFTFVPDAPILTKTQTARAKISATRTRTQTATAKIAKTVTRTQTSIARISNGYTQTQTATARIATRPTITQSATANIGQTQVKTQSAIAAISNDFSTTQTATAYVYYRPSLEQTATAYIGTVYVVPPSGGESNIYEITGIDSGDYDVQVIDESNIYGVE